MVVVAVPLLLPSVSPAERLFSLFSAPTLRLVALFFPLSEEFVFTDDFDSLGFFFNTAGGDDDSEGPQSSAGALEFFSAEPRVLFVTFDCCC